eukprot:m.290927 g.290927  ORF g.290927 m.290927 type:complete len:53 (+) comp199454_c0_seq1:74-232(+)
MFQKNNYQCTVSSIVIMPVAFSKTYQSKNTNNKNNTNNNSKKFNPNDNVNDN